jgi:hypothetical protein
VARIREAPAKPITKSGDETSSVPMFVQEHTPASVGRQFESAHLRRFVSSAWRGLVRSSALDFVNHNLVSGVYISSNEVRDPISRIH